MLWILNKIENCGVSFKFKSDYASFYFFSHSAYFFLDKLGKKKAW